MQRCLPADRCGPPAIREWSRAFGAYREVCPLAILDLCAVAHIGHNRRCWFNGNSDCFGVAEAIGIAHAHPVVLVSQTLQFTRIQRAAGGAFDRVTNVAALAAIPLV